MKKIIALLLALVMVLGMVGCGSSSSSDSSSADAGSDTSSEAAATLNIGLVCIGDENDQGYTYNFMRGVDSVTEVFEAKGVTLNWIVKYNIGESTDCEDACVELAEEGCELIICNSYGHEPFMLKVAPEYPEIEFISCTNLASTYDELDNTHNGFANIYEGRYAAGVVAGMKMQEMIDTGVIAEDEAVIGYVGAFAYSEVVSGFTSFYLGARSVCPSATMMVQYVSSWSDPTAESQAAQALIDAGAVLISQHSDNTTPATTAQQNGVFHCGYNNDMISVAPEASLISTRIDWTIYFEYAIDAVLAGEEFAQDWTAGMNEGAVIVTELNEDIAAPGTAEKLEEVMAGISDGSIEVFAGPWTGVGTAYGADAPDTMVVAEGEFYTESNVANGEPSAPSFYWIIEGITELNSGF